MPAGRPTDYNPIIAEEICNQIADGHSLKRICEAEEMPTRMTVYNWLNAHKEFFDTYTRARQIQADGFVDELIEIADDGTNDFVDKTKDGEVVGQQFSMESVHRSRLRFDARKWIAERMRPKVYLNPETGGEAQDVTTAIQKLIEAMPD